MLKKSEQHQCIGDGCDGGGGGGGSGGGGSVKRQENNQQRKRKQQIRGMESKTNLVGKMVILKYTYILNCMYIHTSIHLYTHNRYKIVHVVCHGMYCVPLDHSADA